MSRRDMDFDVAERVRDRAGASKRTVMWIGELPSDYIYRDKKLIIAPEEAEAVRWLVYFEASLAQE